MKKPGKKAKKTAKRNHRKKLQVVDDHELGPPPAKQIKIDPQQDEMSWKIKMIK